MRRICSITVMLLLVNVSYSLAAISCPPMPTAITEVNRDAKSDISASVASLGKVKAGEVATKTEVTAKNLFAKYPNVDKLLALQTMTATYCTMLRESTTLSDKERLDRWEKFQEKVLNLESRPNPVKQARAKPKPKSVINNKDKKKGTNNGDNVYNFKPTQPLNERD
jgi:hypothetical protein